MSERGPQQLLYVNHRGQWKLTGKVFRVKENLVCLHEESGTQSHTTTDSPGGVDQLVVDYLGLQQVRFYVHAIKGGACWSIPVTKLAFPFGQWHTWDGRERVYVPYHHWQEQPSVWFPVPHIPDEYAVYLKVAERARIPKPRCRRCGHELSILVTDPEPLCGWCKGMPRRAANSHRLR